MKIVKIEGQWLVETWVDGILVPKQKTLDEEARRNPEAVLNRLFLQERWEEAERIMDRYV